MLSSSYVAEIESYLSLVQALVIGSKRKYIKYNFNFQNMDNKKTIDALNDLIEINNDRIEGYQTASGETEDFDLQALFAAFIKTSQKCREELVDEVKLLGGEPAEGTRVSGKFFRAWMDFKAALTANDRKKILESCEFGEDAAMHTYENALKKREDIPLNIYTLIDAQYENIRLDRNKIKIMIEQLQD